MVTAPSLAEKVVPYRISVVRSEEGRPDAVWRADVDELPNCSALGATPEEAVRRVWAAAEGLLEQEREREGDGLRPTTGRGHSGKLLVRMPATLHDELARTAEREGVSLNQLITGVLASSVEWRTDAAVTEAHGGSQRFSGRLTPIALAANFTVVVVAAAAAIALIVLALRDGW
jgi:predicted RNase H-like HicB family nuclease